MDRSTYALRNALRDLANFGQYLQGTQGRTVERGLYEKAILHVGNMPCPVKRSGPPPQIDLIDRVRSA